MPSRTFIIGFISGVVAALVISFTAYMFFSSSTVNGALNPAPLKTGTLYAAGPEPVLTSSLDSYDGLREVEGIHKASVKIADKLDEIADRIYSLSRSLDEIADWRLGR